ncbi:MAG TPA: DUF3866 family protein, partial [Gaiellaceae bacterium]|nr:DUF3866 family protein [Gaiellaceae bacterium]
MTAVRERLEGLVRLEVDGIACVAYPQLTGPVALADEVLVNEQARSLGLGSGGFDVLHANLTRGLGLAASPGAHVIKLPYTPVQVAVRHGEEDGPLAESLDGLPVVCCSLHSQLVPVCAALAGRRVAYVQLEGGALPVALSDAVRALRERGLLDLAIGAGACFGGEVDCVNVWSALALARARGAEAAVCAVGPGIVGTGTAVGHGGMAAALAAFAAASLGGRAVVAPRVSAADPRDRHRGRSHHTDAVLRAVPDALVPDDLDRDGWRAACAGLPLSHMGRDADADPAFFAAAFAAGRTAASLLGARFSTFGTQSARPRPPAAATLVLPRGGRGFG